MVNTDDSTGRRSRSKNLVGFLVGDARYAVDIFRVREIISPLPLVPMPHAPKAVVGVADHRGEVVPVVDLRQRFGLSSVEPTRRTKWIIVVLDPARSGGRVAGLVVDAVTDVFAAEPGEQREVPEFGAGDEERGISSVYSHDGSLTFVIDVDVVATAATELDLPQHGALL